MAGGMCVVGSVCVAGGMHGGRACMAGSGHGGVECVVVVVGEGGGVRGRRYGHCSGRYAFFWNAFLLRNEFIILYSFLLTEYIVK